MEFRNRVGLVLSIFFLTIVTSNRMLTCFSPSYFNVFFSITVQSRSQCFTLCSMHSWLDSSLPFSPCSIRLWTSTNQNGRWVTAWSGTVLVSLWSFPIVWVSWAWATATSGDAIKQLASYVYDIIIRYGLQTHTRGSRCHSHLLQSKGSRILVRSSRCFSSP